MKGQSLVKDKLHRQLWVHHPEQIEWTRKLPVTISGVGVKTHTAPPDGKTIRENLRKARVHLDRTTVYATEQDGLIVIQNYDPEGRRPTLKELAGVICKFHRITFAELSSSSRASHMVRLREQFAYLACVHTTNSLPQIGRFLGDRDHTTIMNNLRMFCDRHGIPMPRGYQYKRRTYKRKLAA